MLMSKITQFSKDNLDSIRNDINEALKAIESKYNIELKTGSLSYSTETFSVKVEAAIKVEGVSNSKDAQEFKKYAMIIGLQASDLGREFLSNRKTWKLLGMKPRKQKTPMICQNVGDGKLYLLSEEEVVKALTTKVA